MPRRPDVLCAGSCGRLLWRGTTSAAEPKCRDCRRATPAPWKNRGRSVTEWDCEWCGTHCTRAPTKGQAPRFCGAACQARASESRTRRERGEFVVTTLRRRSLYERDGWKCRICDLPTSRRWSHDDIWSPTLDHIVPRSATLIPDDRDSNLRTAHWLCNQLRGAAARSDAEVREIALARWEANTHGRTPEPARAPGRALVTAHS